MSLRTFLLLAGVSLCVLLGRRRRQLSGVSGGNELLEAEGRKRKAKTDGYGLRRRALSLVPERPAPDVVLGSGETESSPERDNDAGRVGSFRQYDPNPSEPVEPNPAETRAPLRRGREGFAVMNREAGIEFDDPDAATEFEEEEGAPRGV